MYVQVIERKGAMLSAFYYQDPGEDWCQRWPETLGAAANEAAVQGGWLTEGLRCTSRQHRSDCHRRSSLINHFWTKVTTWAPSMDLKTEEKTHSQQDTDVEFCRSYQLRRTGHLRLTRLENFPPGARVRPAALRLAQVTISVFDERKGYSRLKTNTLACGVM